MRLWQRRCIFCAKNLLTQLSLTLLWKYFECSNKNSAVIMSQMLYYKLRRKFAKCFITNSAVEISQTLNHKLCCGNFFNALSQTLQQKISQRLYHKLAQTLYYKLYVEISQMIYRKLYSGNISNVVTTNSAVEISKMLYLSTIKLPIHINLKTWPYFLYKPKALQYTKAVFSPLFTKHNHAEKVRLYTLVTQKGIE